MTVVPWKTNPTYGDCTRCEAVGVTIGWHRCPPAFRVFNPDYSEEEDAVEVCAHDAEAAAVKYAERHDADRHEYAILNDGQTVVIVSPEGKRTRFNLTGESVPSYSAEELADD